MSREVGNRLLSDDAVISVVGDGVYQLDVDGNFLSTNDAMVGLTGYARDELIGSPFSLLFGDEDTARFDAEIEAPLSKGDEIRTVAVSVHTADGESVPCELRFSVVQSEDGSVAKTAGIVGVARDVSQNAELKAQHVELERLRRINAVIRSIDRAVVRAETADEIEQSVCDRLADAEPYLFALIVRFDPQFEELTPQTWAGEREEYVGYLREANLDVSEGPGAKAVKTRNIQAVQDIDGGEYDWSDPASKCGFKSLAAVPLAHEQTVYGVLAVYSDRPYAFDEPERELLSELAELVGYALFAVKTQQALVGERVIELEFRLADEEYVFTTLSAKEECTVQLEDAVLRPDDSLLLYVSVQGSDPKQVVEFCREFDDVSHLRVLSTREDECSLEIRYGEPMVLRSLSHHGGVIKSAVAEDGVSHVQIDLPETGDVRQIVDLLGEVFDTAELVSRRTVERPVETRAEFRDTLDEGLTDRQRTVLVAAYRSGYFDWPRESTGEELAESLDIAPPTLHKHLRLAEQKLLSTIFDADNRG
ncbi:bacterio-opsin activator domain-containing protein [Haladaptatus cibarius]|uniref:bacterio-opsin activator domain-containing protein n=1 Tax=Haladaptatus cibarius TaxID=453847 RepID=UPI0006790340|nr:bacterio-opsin activator domain-containing protein [Haladaptatus cibarius]